MWVLVGCGAVVLLALCAYLYSRYQTQRALNAFAEKSVADKKLIFHHIPTWNQPTYSVSPFVNKIHAFLHLHREQIPFVVDNDPDFFTHPQTAKMPWVTYKGAVITVYTHAIEYAFCNMYCMCVRIWRMIAGEHIGDSQVIMDTLCADYGIDMDGSLSMEQAAVSRAMRRMVEEGLYWSIVYNRWVDPRNGAGALVFQDMKAVMGLPALLAPIVFYVFQSQIQKKVDSVCFGVHIFSCTCDNKTLCVRTAKAHW